MGHTIYTLSTILSSYLAGLALGALLSKKLIEQYKNETFNIYLLFELIIGIYGICFFPIMKMIQPFYDYVVISRDFPLPILSFVQFIFTSVIILIPTTLMGATLPLLGEHLYKSSSELSKNISSLYGINTLGGLLGCLSAGYLILPEVGYFKTVILCAFINMAIFLIATNYIKSFNFPKINLLSLIPSFKINSGSFSRLDLFHFVVIFVSGLISVSIQILWHRYASLSFGGSAYIFPLITGLVLFGIYLGSKYVSHRMKSSSTSEKDLFFLILVAGVLILIGSQLFAYSGYVIHYFHQNFKLYFTSYQLIQFLIVFILLLPGATLLGGLFPLSLSLHLKRSNKSASKIGLLYALNSLCRQGYLNRRFF